MTAPGRERRANIPERVSPKSVYACQLCKLDREGHNVSRAVTIVAGYRICERHLRILIALLEGK